MCGILAILGSTEEEIELRAKALNLSKRLRHRGPDWNGIYLHHSSCRPHEINVLAHERLSIVDLENGAQPLFNQDKTVALCVNGEIYNHEQLREDLNSYKFMTKSDCECIIPLYMKYKHNLLSKIDGMFAFILYDSTDSSYFAARDPIGICSMYIGWHHSGSVWIASEMKALQECSLVKEFPPGHYLTNETGEFVRWYNPIWLDESYLPHDHVDLKLVRSALEESVIKRMMADVPFGVLLSGGLDSSLIASIAARYRDSVANTEKDYGYVSVNLLTFSIGLEGSPDLLWAKKVAEFIGSKHHSFTFTIEEGIDALHDVINHIESYDVTTVRASTPMFLMARRIKAMGIKVVLSGEGSDEMFGGYLYFHKAPSSQDFHRELVRKVKALSKYDCLRANKSTAAWGVETRVPFLDKQFLNVVMGTDAKYKMINGNQSMEKFILRKAFDDTDKPYLPKEVLWRQKEQFSDGVGYSWIDSLKDHANKTISDQQFKMAPIIYSYNTPTTKEAYLYRKIFDSIFMKETFAKTVPSGSSIACSTEAALKWDKSWANQADPSGRAIVGVHEKAIVTAN